MKFFLFLPKKININLKKTGIFFTYLNKYFFFALKNFKKNNLLLLSNYSLKPLKNFFLDILANVIIYMEIVGFNYKVNYFKDEKKIFFFIGFTNLVIFFHAIDILFKILDKKNKIYQLQNLNRLSLVPFALKLRSFKPPNIYTGHGIRFYKENLILKQIKK